MIRVLFFASLREQLDCAELQVDAGECRTLTELREQLSGRGESWRRALADPSLQAALNREVAFGEAALNSGDEVAFFPPVTGG